MDLDNLLIVMAMEEVSKKNPDKSVSITSSKGPICGFVPLNSTGRIVLELDEDNPNVQRYLSTLE